MRVKPWTGQTPPKKILAIRYQALGDTIITLPYLQNIVHQYPEVEIHFLTRKEVAAIPQQTGIFKRIIAIGGGRNARLQFLLTLLKLPALWLQGYDAILDLQNHKISVIVRRLLMANAWAEFDRSSPLPAGERTRQTIEALWTWRIQLDSTFSNNAEKAIGFLEKNGFRSGHELVVLNPAGYCSSRNWPTEYYIQFARAWREKINPKTQFLLLLLPSHRTKAQAIKDALQNSCIDLTGMANQEEAFSIIGQCSFMLSEDSGLMHMAWVQGIPTLALFSSSRKDWSMPLGKRTFCFDSSDLPCGPCMLETCGFGDNRCLTRNTPDLVLQKAIELRSMPDAV